MEEIAANSKDLYGGRAPEDVPFYSIRDVARYLGVPRATLRAWVFGQGRFRAVLTTPAARDRLLSFSHLVEAHVLEALRHEHHLSLQKVRAAIGYLQRALGARRPLLEYKLSTDGLDLFVERYGQLINASQEGQLGLRRVLEAYLRRVEWDKTGRAVRLYPFTRRHSLDEPRSVVIDPRVGLGRPVIAGTSIPTAIIAQRWKAGESIEDLAKDYGRPTSDIQEAVRCEWAA